VGLDRDILTDVYRGPIPIHLMECAPPALRTTAVGLTYQLGNLASSASATIQAIIGEDFPLPPHDGVERFDYGKVIGIFMGAVWAYQFIFLFLGPEMSEEERAEYAAQADELEGLRKAGRSLADIGVERVKSRQVVDKRPEESTDKTVGEHLEKA
jgi:MFS transporter, SHS family, lactate transporter